MTPNKVAPSTSPLSCLASPSPTLLLQTIHDPTLVLCGSPFMILKFKLQDYIGNLKVVQERKFHFAQYPRSHPRRPPHGAQPRPMEPPRPLQ